MAIAVEDEEEVEEEEDTAVEESVFEVVRRTFPSS